jgi:hypothetical protein
MQNLLDLKFEEYHYATAPFNKGNHTGYIHKNMKENTYVVVALTDTSAIYVLENVTDVEVNKCLQMNDTDFNNLIESLR